MGFRVGQRVVCVKWHGSRLSIKPPLNANMPEIGEFYTIRDMNDYGDVVLVRLHELDNCHLGFPCEPGFNTSGFRPLQETSMSILYGLLKTKDEKELA